MKIYISGKISGLDFAYVEKKFSDAQDLFEALGFEVVNPLKNGLTKNHTWGEHISRDIELLMSCQAIYMFDNWIDSTGAGIEYDIAIRTNKDIWFETNIICHQNNVLKIQKAIHEVTGMKFNEYTTKSRKRDCFFARMIFVYYCRKREMKLLDIAKYINRDHSSILHMLKKYDDEIKYNSNFRTLARLVENILKQPIK